LRQAPEYALPAVIGPRPGFLIAIGPAGKREDEEAERIVRWWQDSAAPA
jgi:hypothetical protein